MAVLPNFCIRVVTAVRHDHEGGCAAGVELMHFRLAERASAEDDEPGVSQLHPRGCRIRPTASNIG
jgi:hypothetical protein